MAEPLHWLLQRLSGGDRRSIGRADDVVAEVLRDRTLVGALFDGLEGGDVLVRMRAADALEKVTARHPEWLACFKPRLFRIAASATQKEVRWHIAQMLPRLRLGAGDRRLAAGLLRDYLSDRSSIVKTFALDALAALSARDPLLRAGAAALLRKALRAGTPAMRSRARRLLKGFSAGEAQERQDLCGRRPAPAKDACGS